MFNNQSRKEGTINSARHIVPCRNREKRPSVIIEPDSVIKASGLCRLLTKTHHAFGAVVEPPRGPQPQTRIVSGKRGKLTAVSRFIEGEQNQRESRLIAETV